MRELEEIGPVSLLIVEDDSFNQTLATAVFEDYENIEVFNAENGELAFAILQKKTIDIILLDLMMPNMNGFEMLKKLKKNSLYHEIPVIIVTSEENERKSTYKLGASDFISKPYNPTELRLRVLNNLKIKNFSTLLNKIKINTEEDIPLSDLADINQNIQKALRIADSTQKKLLEKLGNLAHKRAEEINTSQRLGEYAALLATLYGLNKREVDNIFYAMSIYDIGLLLLSKNTYSNTNGKLFMSHPELGLELLNDLEETPLIEMAKIVTLSHHEHWDGTGYPKGLDGEEIPLFARIASIADYFDELTSPRCYDEEYISPEDALSVIQRERGKKLDPEILDIFIEHFSLFAAIKNKYAYSS